MTAMDFRTVIALFMGLLIQLSQVQTCSAGGVAPPCAKPTHSMACCDGVKSCPCAKDSDSNQKPALPVTAEVDLKLLVSKADDDDLLAAPVSSPGVLALPAVSFSENRAGYAGVPLSVAFCRFVI